MMAKKYILFFIILSSLIKVETLSAQQCAVTPTLVYSPGPGGVYNFSVIPNTNGSYFWDFGNGTFTSNINLISTSCTYTSNGVYFAYCTFSNTALSCTATTNVATITVGNACGLNFTITPSDPPNACNGSIAVSNLGQCANTTYTWSNNTQGNVLVGICSGGIYTVQSNSSNNCCPYLPGVVTVPPCSLAASFTTVDVGGGQINFISTSTSTNANTTYNWNFGDGTSFTSSSAVSHTYANSGTYTVTLFASNNANNMCICTYSAVINVCNVVASFSYSEGGNNTIIFTSTSAGTNSNSIYAWNYGDNAIGSNATSSHTYSANGIYSVQLIVTNTPSCADTTIFGITVTNVIGPCIILPNFTHTVLPSGQVNFSSTSTNTTGASSYYWDFGDGVYSNVASPSHNYIYNGTYVVKLKVTENAFCKDSIEANVNITGLACVANAIFNLSPGNQPQYWNAVPLYPWNVTSATWDWGDGTSNNALYTSHTYSAPGNYNVCLTITVSCGASGSFCSYSTVYRSQNANGEQAMVYINTLKPGITNSIASLDTDKMQCTFFPNPSSGTFELVVSGLNTEPLNITVYNLLGETIFYSDYKPTTELTEKINLTDVTDGVYLLNIRNGNKTQSKKLIISK